MILQKEEKMKALILEKVKQLSLRDIKIVETLGPRDVRIAINNVGICGSDLHFYQHGRIGPFAVKEPLVLGHEASGTVIEVGADVRHLKIGDRVCMEPGIPDPNSKATRLGLYNIDPAVRFWSAPPIHGCLRENLVHPAEFTFKLPDNVSYAEGALVEPLAIGVHGANKAHVKPGDLAVVLGAGTIGMVTALAALAAGCSQVVITDVQQPKLDLAATLGPITPVNVKKQKLTDVVQDLTGGWGADIVFEASGNEQAAASVFDSLCPGGRVVFIGMPIEPISYDVVAAQAKEASIEHVFRYAHEYPRVVALIASGKVNVKPLITDTFAFEDSIKAFDFASSMPPSSVKVQIVLRK
jgi:D-xylulose reductase